VICFGVFGVTMELWQAAALGMIVVSMLVYAAIFHALDKPRNHPPADFDPRAGRDAQVRQLLQQGDAFGAAERYRELTNCGWLQARAAIDYLMLEVHSPRR
jgi:hypothetical protein